MSIQMYVSRKNFDTQKAERFFKERRIPVQLMDLKKHRLGEREIRVMLNAVGAENLIDRAEKKVKEHPACYYDRESLLIPAIQEAPWLLKSPIIRNGTKVIVGWQPDALKEMAEEEQPR